MGKHAKLSASGSKRWITCPGSVRLEGDAPKSASSIFAMQGTAAHFIGDRCLSSGEDAIAYLGAKVYVHEDFDEELIPANATGAALKREAHLKDLGYIGFTITEDDSSADCLETWAIQMYLDAVRKDFTEQQEFFGGLELRTEHYLDMSWLHPLMGGTADAHYLLPTKWVKLFDLKYGSGVVVEVKDNSQQKIYAVGILKDYPEAVGVSMTIAQPRLDHPDGPIRTVSYTRKELEDYAKFLVVAAENTQRPNAEFKADPEACRFCSAKRICAEFKAETLRRAKIDFSEAPEMVSAPTDNEELAHLADWLPMMDALAKDVEGAIARELHQGRRVRGRKLVRKKTNRKWGDAEKLEPYDEATVVKLLAEEGVSEIDMFHAPELKSVAQMEKIGKDVKKAVAKFNYKPEGDLTVAPEGDAREAVVIESPDFPDDDVLEGMT